MHGFSSSSFTNMGETARPESGVRPFNIDSLSDLAPAMRGEETIVEEKQREFSEKCRECIYDVLFTPYQ